MWAPHLANNDGAVKKQKTSLPKIPRTPRGARAALLGRPPTPRRQVSQAHPGPPGLLRAPQRLRGAEGGDGRRKGEMREPSGRGLEETDHYLKRGGFESRNLIDLIEFLLLSMKGRSTPKVK